MISLGAVMTVASVLRLAVAEIAFVSIPYEAVVGQSYK